MELKPGDKLSPYELVSAIGRGGMGEVWKARDPRLGRDVAIKVSAQQFTDRFEREARAIAALNHTNICTLYDVGPNYLVMELIEGPTLADRIAPDGKPGPMPLEEALGIAKQIAAALEAAHDKNIVHRDLKPANVKIRPDGSVKVLDFGLAKAGDAQEVTADSPTMMPGTQIGMILGTAGYMSPEQARGKEVDKRADIWAFGVVLYEMVTGKRLFQGEDLTETLASVVKDKPDLSSAPLQVHPLLNRCLEKDPKKRLRDIGDAMAWVDTELTAELPTAASSPSRLGKTGWIAATALLAVVAGGLGFIAYRATRPTEPKLLMRLNADVGAEVSLGSGEGPTLAIAPEGSRLVFVTRTSDGKDHLAMRLLDSAQTTVLADTEGAAIPFFSPDSRWFGFFAGGKLRKMSVEGGKAVTLCDARNPRGASWGEDGNIVFAAENRAALSRVSSSGGEPKPATELDTKKGEITNRYPQVLPGGEAFLFQSRTAQATNLESTIQVQSVKTGQRKTLITGVSYARYLPGGHLVYMHQGTMYAAPVDLKRMELTGPASPVVDDLRSNSNGYAYFDFTSSGTLVYIAEASTGERSLSWLDESGTLTPLRLPPGRYTSIRVSPDGSRMALLASDGAGARLSLYEWAQDRMTHVASFNGAIGSMDWAHDGKHLVFEAGANQLSGPGIYWMRADGSGEPQRLLEGAGWVLGTFSPDGTRLGYWSRVTPYGLWTLPLDLTDPDHPGTGKPESLLKSDAEVRGSTFSPDGRWAAYQSFESGKEEAYVRSFPGLGGKWQVSTGGGGRVWWLPNGRELLYATPDRRIKVVEYSARSDSFAAGQPRLWSQKVVPAFLGDLMPDGKRFAVLVPSAQGDIKPPDHVVFLLNFFDELRRKVPVGK
jgi:Tol biopolymer transport system component/tRNA A-37 threonylcarbamoyl transferase component Bud32